VHIRLITIGARQPPWVDAAYDEFALRLPRQWQFRLDAIATAKRPKGSDERVARGTEGQKILEKLKYADFAVLLDERGKQFTSCEFADVLNRWQKLGQDIVFIIGGPDGVSPEVRERANLVWSLSRLTLPHGLARILLVEQLYRAWSISAGHPYHRG
jgi:23S rRNA (pseudouridine1915-N3)-methyltransferase